MYLVASVSFVGSAITSLGKREPVALCFVAFFTSNDLSRPLSFVHSSCWSHLRLWLFLDIFFFFYYSSNRKCKVQVVG